MQSVRVEMNYLKVYCNLIRKAENRTLLDGYTEKHHTFPKSIFGKNNRIVVLTAREHYIAHALLEKICIKKYGLNHWKTKKMINAFWCMNSQKSKNTYIKSHLYESSRLRRSILMSGKNNHMYGKKISEETKEKRSKAHTGKKMSLESRAKMSEAAKKRPKENYFGRKHSEETKLKLRNLNKGKKIPNEVRKKMSDANKGENNHYFGKKHSLEIRQKMSGENHSRSMWWKITFADGNVIEQCGLTNWSKENGYSQGAIYKVAYGKKKKYKDIVAVEKLAHRGSY